MYSVPGDRIHLDYTGIHPQYSGHTVVLRSTLCIVCPVEGYGSTIPEYIPEYSYNTVILSVLRVRSQNTIKLYLNTCSEYVQLVQYFMYCRSAPGIPSGYTVNTTRNTQ